MTAQELEDFHKGKYLHWGLFLKDQARIDQLIKDAVAKGTYLNPTLVYELGSQTALARESRGRGLYLFRDEKLMAYFPRNLAEGALFKLRAARNFSRDMKNQAAFRFSIRKTGSSFKMPIVVRPVPEEVGCGRRKDHRRHGRSFLGHRRA